MSSDIILQNDQASHIQKIQEIFQRSFGAYDLSVMGSGKTFTSSYLAKKLRIPLFVVCPCIVEEKWRDMQRYGVKLEFVVSYQTLRSRKGIQPKHNYLERKDMQDGSVLFTATPKLLSLIQDGCLFVFDEAQNIKNKNDQWSACKAISTAVLQTGGKSRFLLLSGTPIDKEEHAIHLLSLMGFIRHPKLYNYNKEEDTLRLFGAQELLHYCEFIDKEKTQDFLRRNRFHRDTVHHNCYLLFQQILKPKISSAMAPPKINVEIDCKNGYYNIDDEEDSENLIRGIHSLCTATRFEERGSAEFTNDNMGVITKSLMKIEKAKVKTFYRLGVSLLQKDDKAKIGIFVNYSENLELLAELFASYKPIVISGKTPKETRLRMLDKFQQQNTDYRVVLGNLQVCSVGIDLNDQSEDGRFPRFAFGSPNYSILNLHQLTRRFHRMNSTSNSIFRFVYGKIDGRKETSILNSLAKKTNILKDTLDSQVEYNILFPGDYESYIES